MAASAIHRRLRDGVGIRFNDVLDQSALVTSIPDPESGIIRIPLADSRTALKIDVLFSTGVTKGILRIILDRLR